MSPLDLARCRAAAAWLVARCRAFARCLAAVLLAVVAVGAPETALAHGPCGCLTPPEGPPGTRVQVAYPLYKVVFNPDRADLAIGPRSLWSEHRGDPPIVVYRAAWRYSRDPLNTGGSFVVPPVAPGRYLVALYDGSEGGMHYSWEHFTVRGERARPVTARVVPSPVRRSGVPAGLVAAGIAAALLTGCAGGLLVRVRRRR